MTTYEREERRAELAMIVAMQAHRGQTRKFDGAPYIVHPAAVAKMQESPRGELLGWLHDVVENTDVTIEEIEVTFGEDVAVQLRALTRLASETYKEYIRRIGESDGFVIDVKLADLRHNLSSLPVGHSLVDRYMDALEYLEELGR